MISLSSKADANFIKMRIPLIPPLDSEGIRHPVPIQVAMVFRLIPPPWPERSDAGF